MADGTMTAQHCRACQAVIEDTPRLGRHCSNPDCGMGDLVDVPPLEFERRGLVANRYRVFLDRDDWPPVWFDRAGKIVN